MNTCLWVARRVSQALITDPLYHVFRHGPCVSRYVPMYCGMSNVEICARLVERVGEATWNKVPEDCDALIDREFQSWQVLVRFVVYVYIAVHLGSIVQTIARACLRSDHPFQ